MQFKRSQPSCSSTPERGARALPASAAYQRRARLGYAQRGKLEWDRLPMAATRKQKKLNRLPPEQSSVIDSSIVSLWFALRAAVLRLAVSHLWSLAGQQSRAVAVTVAHGQNWPMSSQSTELSHDPAMVVSGVAEKCKLGTVSAVRANPAFKRTAYGRRLTPR